MTLPKFTVEVEILDPAQHISKWLKATASVTFDGFGTITDFHVIKSKAHRPNPFWVAPPTVKNDYRYDVVVILEPDLEKAVFAAILADFQAQLDAIAKKQAQITQIDPPKPMLAESLHDALAKEEENATVTPEPRADAVTPEKETKVLAYITKHGEISLRGIKSGLVKSVGPAGVVAKTVSSLIGQGKIVETKPKCYRAVFAISEIASL